MARERTQRHSSHRSGDAYKPSTIRSYELALRGGEMGEGGLMREFGSTRLSALNIEDVQAFVDRLLSAGAQPSTISNRVMPLRVICRWRRAEVPLNPTLGLNLPAVRLTRNRIASPAEAELLVAALSARDRPLWATAMYAGLRRGELMALRWCDVDLASGVIEVPSAWDPKEHLIVAPKCAAGTRRVPIAMVLRGFLAPLSLAAAADADGLVFGTGGRPFGVTSLYERACGPGIGRSSTRSAYTIAAIPREPDDRWGVNAKALSTFMGTRTSR